MPTELSIAYITGAAEVKKNHFLSDTTIPRIPRSFHEMFFQPYESAEEFVYCARHTFQPLLLISLIILNPDLLITIPVYIIGAATAFATLGLLGQNFDDKSTIAHYSLEMAGVLMNDLLQNVVDIAMLPLSLLIMTTRSSSSLINAFHSDEPEANTLFNEEKKALVRECFTP